MCIYVKVERNLPPLLSPWSCLPPPPTTPCEIQWARIRTTTHREMNNTSVAWTADEWRHDASMDRWNRARFQHFSSQQNTCMASQKAGFHQSTLLYAVILPTEWRRAKIFNWGIGTRFSLISPCDFYKLPFWLLRTSSSFVFFNFAFFYIF